MRYDHAVLSREVLEVMSGILERKLQVEKAAAEKHRHASDPSQNERWRIETAGAPAPLTSRTPAA
jgi:hypothetical protein